MGGRILKKTKKILVILALVLCMALPILGGCGLFNAGFSCTADDDNEYTLTIYEDSKAFSWQGVKNAKSYNIYCNDKLVDTVDSDECIYKFGYLLEDAGDYQFRVEARRSSGSYTSMYSVNQVATYHNDNDKEDIVSTPAFSESDEKVRLEYDTTNRIIFRPISEAQLSDYSLALYSNDLGYREYPISESYYNETTNKFTVPLTGVRFRKEISVIRVVALVDGEKRIVSDYLYYNPDNFTGYTGNDNIYTFDGKIYDHYINTLDELQNLIYHSFIYREEDFNIKISREIYNMAMLFDGGNFEECLDLLIYQYGFGSFSETMAYMAGNVVGEDRYFAKAISSKDMTYNIKVSYLGVYECDLNKKTTQEYVMTQERSEGYYDTVDYTMISDMSEDYAFASDNWFLETEVETTEELYWAVENKVTPVFKNTTSRAYRIYNEAKEVLGDIISLEMSDFEKVLSIFDWICINTVYDYSAYSDDNTIPTEYPCYYLEGVFDKGMAVCDGFSKAFSLMCNMLDIDAIRIVGTAVSDGSEGGHAWNKVLLDKDPSDNIPAQYYIVDITWTEIYSSYTNEILSHKYFLVSDVMVEDSHTDYPYREEFKSLLAPDMYEYYRCRKFEYNGQEYDAVIDNDDDISALFDYMMLNSLDTVEMIFDLDYLKAKYRESTGKEYSSRGDIGYSLLKSNIIPVLKESKFAEQYIFMAYSTDAIVYDNDGSLGLVYTFTHNYLIDAEEDIAHLVNALSEKNITGTVNIYIDNEVLKRGNGVDYIGDYIKMINKLFASSLENTNLSLSFEVVETYNPYDETETDLLYATVYSMTISVNE